MSLDAEYFRNVYAAGEDPFSLGTKWYERRKYALTMASLPKPRYRRALEPGCSIGVLTDLLAQRCERVVSTDVVQAALDSARTRLTDSGTVGGVDFVLWSLSDPWTALPGHDEPFDLIVVSEVGYYLSESALVTAMNEVVAHLEPGGTLVCVHWRHEVEDYPLGGDRVQELIASTDGLANLSHYQDQDMSIDVHVRSSGPVISVAATDGLDVRTNRPT